MTETSLPVAIAVCYNIKAPLAYILQREALSSFLRAKFENHLTRPCNKENLLQKFQINHKYNRSCTEFGKGRERTSNSGFQRRW